MKNLYVQFVICQEKGNHSVHLFVPAAAATEKAKTLNQHFVAF